MRRSLIAAASSIGLLMAGAAYAQDTSPTPPPAAGNSDYLSGQPSTTGTTSISSPADSASAENLLGRTVIGSDGEEIGEVEDVVLNADTGAAERLIVSSGGVLGIGGKTIAVDFSDAAYDQEEEQVRLANLTSAQLEAMSEFEYEDSTVSLGRGNADSVGGTQMEPMEAAPAEKPELGE